MIGTEFDGHSFDHVPLAEPLASPSLSIAGSNSMFEVDVDESAPSISPDAFRIDQSPEARLPSSRRSVEAPLPLEIE